MNDLSTALRAVLTKRLDPTVYSYLMLGGLVIAVIVMGALIVAGQLKGL